METPRNLYTTNPNIRMNTTKKEERKINQIQENIIRRILIVPQSTPTEALYMETRLLDITTIITKKNRFNMEKRLHKHPENITTKIMETNTTGGWKETTTGMREQSNETLQNTNFSPLLATFHYFPHFCPLLPTFAQLFTTFHYFSLLLATFSHFSHILISIIEVLPKCIASCSSS